MSSTEGIEGKWTKEEKEAIYERIKDLKKKVVRLEQQLNADVLGIAQHLACANIDSFFCLFIWPVVKMGKEEAFEGYMMPKAQSIKAEIYAAQSIDAVFNLHDDFIKDCAAYMGSLAE